MTRAFELLREAFPSGTMTLAAGAVAGQAALVLVTPILTRLYRPEDFGVYAAATLMVSLVAVVAALRYERAIFLASSGSELVGVIALCGLMIVTTSAVSGLTLLIWGEAIISALNVPGLGSVLWMLIPVQVLLAGHEVIGNTLVRVGRFRAAAWQSVLMSGGIGGSQLVLGGAGLAAPGLILGEALGRLASAVVVMAPAIHGLRGWLESVSWRAIKLAAVRFRRFPQMAGPSAILNAFSLQAPLLILLVLHGPAIGGLYLLVQRLASLPLRLIGRAVARSYVAEASRLAAARDHIGLERLFSGTARALLLVAGLPLLIASLTGPALVPIVFGQEWAMAGIFLPLLIPYYVLQLVGSPLGETLGALERQDLLLVSEVARSVSMVALLFVGAAVNASPVALVVMISAVGSGSYLLLTHLSRRAIRDSAEASGARC